MRWLRSDLPLASDASGRFLPWIIGCMVYLAALALAATIAADRVAQRWHTELAGTFSIQLPPDAAAPNGDRTALVTSVVDLLMNTGSVASARIVDDAEKTRLLEPWLGAGGLPEGVHLPDLVVVQLMPGAPLSVKDLRARINQVAPQATIEDHAAWQGDMLAFARSVELLAGIIIGLIGAAAVTTVIFVTRTGLSIHRRVIEIVHLVGARDSYIAGQFRMHALRLGLVGGIGGVVLAGLTLMGLDRVLAQTQTSLLPSLALDANQWLALGIVPVAVSVVAMVTAHLTVLVVLGREL